MKSLLRGGIIVFAATLVWQMSNFAFNIIGAHELGPAKYGILASAVGLAYLLSPVVLAVQTVASRESTSVLVDGQGTQIRAIVNYYLARVGLAGLGLAALVAALSPVISRALRLDSPGLVMIFALVIPTLVATAIVRGVHQGTRRFERYSLGTLAEGLAKVGAAVLFFGMLWQEPLSGMLALFVSAFTGLTVNLLLLRHLPRPTAAIRPNRHLVRYSATTVTIFVLLAVLLSTDTMAARLTLPAREAGIYAGISLTGKIVYFATTALTAFVFPIFSTRFDQGLPTRRWLALCVALVVVVSASTVAIFAWAPYLVTSILLGPRFRPVAHSIWVMGAIFSLYALTNLIVMYLLARRQAGIAVGLLVAVAVQVGGFAAFHRSVADLMAVIAVAFATALVASCIVGVVGQAARAVAPAAAAAPAGTLTERRPRDRGRHRAVRPSGRYLWYWHAAPGQHRGGPRRSGWAAIGWP